MKFLNSGGGGLGKGGFHEVAIGGWLWAGQQAGYIKNKEEISRSSYCRYSYSG
jgi:hypothetical protein